MSNRFTFLVVGALLGVGAMFVARQLAPRPGASPSETAADEPARDARTVAAPVLERTAPNRLAVEALERRLERIERKLDQRTESEGAAGAKEQAARAEAEAKLFKGLTPSDRDPRQQQAFERASAIIEGAIRVGVWNDSDQKAMRDAVEQLAPADRISLRMKLAVAGNEDRLRDFAHEPMFF
jgi:hypothetical protein